jgi:hypothetical protein
LLVHAEIVAETPLANQQTEVFFATYRVPNYSHITFDSGFTAARSSSELTPAGRSDAASGPDR